MELFARSTREVEVVVDEEEEEIEVVESKSVSEAVSINTGDEASYETSTFASLGLDPTICSRLDSIGFHRPTPIQHACIPSILKGRDVLACAETGSGKTAAFLLPMIHILQEDPYGIFGVVLTPTRELAIQISEQLAILGKGSQQGKDETGNGVSYNLTIGGDSMIQQSINLARRPHFIIATPGRLSYLLSSNSDHDDPSAFNLRKARFLVLDEADRLLTLGFTDSLEIIFSSMSHPKRQTLLFSATLTESMKDIKSLAMTRNALLFDLTKERKLPSTLAQEYLFMPSKIKICFLVALLKKFFGEDEDEDDDDLIGKKKSKKNKKAKLEEQKFASKRYEGITNKSDEIELLESILNKETSKINTLKKKKDSLVIIFVESCHKCHEITETLKFLGFSCTALHSMLNQSSRIASLNSFKNQLKKILVSTDIGSRGLDIPTVDLVINFELPRIISDYIHRVGRTARAGKHGTALSFITQYDIKLLNEIEDDIKTKLTECKLVTNDDVVPLLTPVTKAMHNVRLEILSSDFAEREQVFKERKRKQKEDLQSKRSKLSE